MRNLKIKIFLQLLFTCVFLTQCQKAPEPLPAVIPTPPEERWTNIGEPTELEGAWSNCRNASGIGSRETLTFQGKELEYSYTMYSSLDCQGPLIEIIAHGTFETFGKAVIPEDGVKITISLKTFYTTVLSGTIADNLNSQSACGISNWTPNKTIPIDLTPCSLNKFFKGFSKENFTIYKIVEGATLFLGEPTGVLNSSSEETRPDHFYSHGLIKIANPSL